tara:strand:- start:1953 stop:2519 length:567 start_codon:yes stop_codon:yes gene_type:complete
MSDQQDNNEEKDDISNISSDSEIDEEVKNQFANDLYPMIDHFKQKLFVTEEKLQRALADYQNLEKRSKMEISQGILQKMNQLMLNFIGIYEDFIRAKTALSGDGVNTEGLDGIVKNMESLLSENNIKTIDALGEIFDPKLHEAVSTVIDDALDDGTITKEVAKGYISFQEVIRPSKVIVSKKSDVKNG